MGLGAMAGDCRAMVAKIDVGLKAGDALAGDTRSLESADQFLGFSGKHGACDDLDAAWCGSGHGAGAASCCGGVVGYRTWALQGERWISWVKYEEGSEWFLHGERRRDRFS